MLATPRLKLVPFSPDLRDAWIAFHRGHESHWVPWTPNRPETLTYEQWFAEVCDFAMKSWEQGTNYRLAGVLPDGSIATLVALNNVVRRAFQCADAGWRVREDLEGQGYVHETMKAVLDAAFAPAGPAGFGLHRVQCGVMPRNTRSIVLARRLGFRQEGLALRMIQINGVWEDHILFAKLADEHEHAQAH